MADFLNDASTARKNMAMLINEKPMTEDTATRPSDAGTSSRMT